MLWRTLRVRHSFLGFYDLIFDLADQDLKQKYERSHRNITSPHEASQYI